MEHRRVLEECKKIMEDYRAVERKLRTHIVKSRCVVCGVGGGGGGGDEMHRQG